MAYIARADGSITPIDASKVTLKYAQGIVGGFVEMVCPIKTRWCIFLCNEEGHLRHLPLNAHGADLYGGPIAGDIIVLDRKEAGSWLE